ncbi:MAG: hypothetical protein CVU56_13605 [Deltaproteobacteria bacterium HGW-Deltaproteobacteria-14]|jgi:hypothetical protein|nr:MAG: hypothetical protein CVU56_13605 [Deltaproteobacteria bacterium HGW-Deltaproteobacteria-14]
MQRQHANHEATTPPAPATDRGGAGASAGRRAALAGHGFAEQEAMLAPGGALSGVVQAKIEDPAQECGPNKQRYADPAPYAWSVSYKRSGLGEGHFDKGAKQDVQVEARYDWAMMNSSNKEPRVEMLQGTVTSTTEEGRKQVDSDKEEVVCSVAENAERFAKAVKQGELFARKGTRVKSKAPRRTDEADVERCG